MTSVQHIDRSAFATALGLAPDEIDSRTCDLLNRAKLSYHDLGPAQQPELEAEIERTIAAGFTVVGEHRANIWRDAWQEQLERFEQSNFDLEALNPKFIAGSPVIRWQGKYVQAISDRFELAFFEILRDWLFRKYLADVGHLYEFGSGSAFNVAAYARLFTDTRITALDWAPAAVGIANLLHQKLGMKVEGRKFDFFAPDRSVVLGPDSAVLTICALEQTGDRFGPFLDYLRESKPKRVVHVEPTVELYDRNSSHDRLAIDYHTQRKYLKGLLPALQQLAQDGKIRLDWVRRLRFGSRFHECFTVIVWTPV